MTNNDALRRSFGYAFIYVGFATFTVLNVYGSSPFYGDWVLVGLLITLPVSILSFGIMYAAKDAYVLVFCVQFIMFILTGRLIYFLYYRNKID